LVEGIQSFTSDEAKSKLTFVRLIGRHDAVFLFVIYSIFTFIFTLVDVFSKDYRVAVNIWYIVYALYAFSRLMEQKRSQGVGLKIISMVSVAVFFATQGYTFMKWIENPHTSRTYPLYMKPIVINSTNSTNVTIAALNITSDL